MELAIRFLELDFLFGIQMLYNGCILDIPFFYFSFWAALVTLFPNKMLPCQVQCNPKVVLSHSRVIPRFVLLIGWEDPRPYF